MNEQGVDQGVDEGTVTVLLQQELRFLTPRQVEMIDEMLEKVSPFGEVTLRVQNGQLRFVAQTKSYDALKMQRPNAANEDSF
ncbi:MAG: hypothetical protein GTO18_09600 [Anaerolineales bacterium]|nr:hypothetical protein [Anaerolineales bacterium]